MKFIMVGHYAGKDVEIGKFKFVKGVCDFPGAPDKLGGLINYLATFGGYPQGSDELMAALGKQKENEVGTGQVLQGQSGSAAGGLQADIPSAGQSGGNGADGTAANGQGSEAQGGGAQTGRVDSGSQDPKTVKVIEAIKMLNPDVPEQWTDEGLPMVAVVAEMSGVPSVNRKDIEVAAPGWNRDKALKAAAADL